MEIHFIGCKKSSVLEFGSYLKDKKHTWMCVIESKQRTQKKRTFWTLFLDEDKGKCHEKELKNRKIVDFRKLKVCISDVYFIQMLKSALKKLVIDQRQQFDSYF